MLPLLIPVAIKLAAEFLPTLAAKIAGDRAGDLAETVVATATAAAGLPRDARPEQIIATLRGNAAALEEVRYKFELLNQQEHQRILEDRQSARAYQAQLGESGRRRGDFMLVGVSLGLLACIVAVVWPGVQIEDAELALLSAVAGALLKMLSDAFAFEFGSSRGSKEKDDQLREFKDALIRVGEERQTATREIIRTQQEGLAAVAKTAVKTAAAAGAGAAAAGAPTGAGPAAAAAPGPRDFVAQLVSGRI
jgi:hypothetical protein